MGFLCSGAAETIAVTLRLSTIVLPNLATNMKRYVLPLHDQTAILPPGISSVGACKGSSNLSAIFAQEKSHPVSSTLQLQSRWMSSALHAAEWQNASRNSISYTAWWGHCILHARCMVNIADVLNLL